MLSARYNRIGHGYARTCRETRVSCSVSTLRSVIDSGAWDRRHGRLRTLESFDAGLRLVVGAP